MHHIRFSSAVLHQRDAIDITRIVTGLLAIVLNLCSDS